MLPALLAAAALAAAGAPPCSTAAPTDLPAAGSPAPDFAYRTFDDHWTSLHEMRAGRAVMLVFAPDSATLAGLEADRAALASRAIVPVAVIDQRDGRAWRIAERLQLHFSLLSDPRGSVAGEFGRWDGTCATPGWCLVGRDGRIVAASAGARTAAELSATATRLAGDPASPSAGD